MIIRKMTAAFGCLENARLELREGLNIIHAPNESGKSTWCAFIRAMLYGIDSAQREKGGQKPDKLRYAPWCGLPMGGEMEIEHGGKSLTLRRSTKLPTAPMREFSAHYTGTAAPVPGLSGSDVGLILTGMPKAVFENSVFVGRASLAVSSGTELEKRINAIISGGDEESESYSDADERLRAWQRKRRHNRSGAIPALEAEISEKQRLLDSMSEAAAEQLRLELRLANAEAAEKMADACPEVSNSPHRHHALRQLEQLRQELDRKEALRAEAMEKAMRAESETEKGYFGGMSASEALFEAGKDADLLSELRSKVPGRTPEIILGVLAALSLIAAAVLELSLFYGAAGVFFMIGLIYAALQNGKRKEASAYAFAIVQRYNAADTEGIMAVAEEHVRACAAAEKANAALEAAEAELMRARSALRSAEDALLGSGFGAEDPALVRAREDTALLRRELALCEGRLEAMGDPMVSATEISALESRRDELEAQYEAIGLAIEALREANDEMQQRFSPALGQRTAEILSRLSGGKYSEVRLDPSLDASAKRSGDSLARERAFLSEGTADQLYLALRLAISELALGDSDCPIILDDALVNFDDERMGYAMEMLLEIAQNRQIILFSCHKREAEYLNSRSGQ